MTSTASFFIRVSSIAAMALFAASCAPKEAYSGLEMEEEEEQMVAREGPVVVTAEPESESEFEMDAAVMEEEEVDLRFDPGNILSERLVFFDFDKFVVRTEYLGMINAHSDYLVSNRDSVMVLQGHADERGSTEYNLALGQRRADAVRDILLASGVYEDQISTISYGEERPRALGHNEGAWAENRRVEFVYADE